MLSTVAGIYRAGHVELSEQPSNIAEDSRVLVTFLDSTTIDLAARGIDVTAAGDLRGRLATFADEWNSPEMTDYDNYDANRKKLETR